MHLNWFVRPRLDGAAKTSMRQKQISMRRSRQRLLQRRPSGCFCSALGHLMAHLMRPSRMAGCRPNDLRHRSEHGEKEKLCNTLVSKGPLWSSNETRMAIGQLGLTPNQELRKPLRLSREPNLCRETLLPDQYHRWIIDQDGNERYSWECWPLWS